ncbi:MAG: ABC transporter permease [Fimbriimonadaceae bacterium]|nr:ABC transporter permease [Fimbriimonadaceae bacterium]
MTDPLGDTLAGFSHSAARSDLAPPLRWANGVKRFAARKPLGAVSGGIILVLVLAAVFAPIVAPYGVSERSRDILESPSMSHLMGTDQLGRDEFSRIIYGARLSLYIGLAATLLSSALGLTVGIAAGYFGGKVDRVLGVVLDSIMAFPALILAIALVAALGPSAQNVVLAILLPSAARFARIVRSDVLRIRSLPYVEAAQTVGCSNFRIVTRHIAPNVMATVIVLASVGLPGAILAESGLSFLGLGPPPPNPSWGRMLSDEGQLFFRSAPWLVIWPGVALAVAVYAFNLLGDALRDYLDPKLRSR